MDLLRVRRVRLQSAGDTVVEAHAECQQKIGLLDRVIDPGFAVHAHHAEVHGMGCREGAETKQRERNRNTGAFGEVAYLLHCAGNDDPMPGQNYRALRVLDQFESLFVFRGLRRKIGAISGQLRLRRFPVELTRRLLGVFGDVDENRAGATGPGDVEGLADRTGDFTGVGDEIVVLRDWQGDAGDVRLLEGVGPDQFAAHLAGDADDRRGVEHGRRNSGDHVCRAGTRGRDGDTDLSAGAGVTVGHMRRALLMAYQHMMDLAVLERIVGWQNRAARVAEHGGDVFALQAFPKDLGSGLRHNFRSSTSGVSWWVSAPGGR